MTLLRLSLAAAIFVVAAAGCGGGESHAITGTKVASALRARLVARDLPPHWVACVPTRARVRGLTAFRCNVNFGDPHVEAYCAVLDRDRLSYAAWRPPDHGRQDRVAAQIECARRLSTGSGQTNG
jgi:hypothetical protein